MLSTPEYVNVFTDYPLVDESSHALHQRLMMWNKRRLAPGLPDCDWMDELRNEGGIGFEEISFVESERQAVREIAAEAPTEPDAFVKWFERLKGTGAGQGDALFPWLASAASLDEMRWFLTQEAAGEAGFDDLVAMTQVRFPVRAKLEMARNYWDEMGRGTERGMHGPMLAAVVTILGLDPSPERTVWESLAQANLMVALAANRRYAYHAVGALGVIEMTAPGRVSCVNDGLKRLRSPIQSRMYFQLHAGLDVKHSKSWNTEIIGPLVAADPRIASAIAEGALMRLAAGARCFNRYRSHLMPSSTPGEMPRHPIVGKGIRPERGG